MKLKCPICKQPTDSETHRGIPVLQRALPRLDLGNWASEKYKVAEPMMDESELEETEAE